MNTFQNIFMLQELWNRQGYGYVLCFTDGYISNELGDRLVPWHNITVSSTVQVLSYFFFMKPSCLFPGILSFLKEVSDCYLILFYYIFYLLTT